MSGEYAPASAAIKFSTSVSSGKALCCMHWAEKSQKQFLRVFFPLAFPACEILSQDLVEIEAGKKEEINQCKNVMIGSALPAGSMKFAAMNNWTN